MRRYLAGIILVVACGRIWKPERDRPPDRWSREVAAIHAMATPPPAFLAERPDCTAAPTPDLELFCAKRCDKIGELTLQAYCAWDCDAVKNPDVGVMCRLEVAMKRSGKVAPEACDDIHASELKAHCQRWIATLQPPARP